jgi:hypothetical protein
MSEQQERPHFARPQQGRINSVELTIVGRALEDLEALRLLTLGASDVEIIQEALAAYRAELAHQEIEP